MPRDLSYILLLEIMFFHMINSEKHTCLEGKVLCPHFKGNGFGPISHSGATLSPKRGEALTHKGELICSHEKCRNSGNSSLYCAHCKDGVPEESFFDKSKQKCKD